MRLGITDRKLELTLFPTEHCNFRCTYCYEDFSLGRMSRPTISGIKALIAARAPTLDRLLISWFGGEPLVAFDIVEEISAAASNMAGQHGFTTDIGITTNGYALTASKAQRLFAAGVTSYQISLDGEEQEHNTTRRRADGAGTFSTIWRNLEALQKLAEDGSIAGTRVMLRLHVHPGNVDSIRRLIDRIKSKLSPGTFSILIKEVGKYGGKTTLPCMYSRAASSVTQILKENSMS